jgi:hypothetical protein
MNLDIIRYYRDAAYPMKMGTNLDLGELFTCYSGGCHSKCRVCGNNKCAKYTRICFPAKTLIIYLERKNHNFYRDINFDLVYDFDPYISKTRREGMFLNTNYELKAVISYAQNLNEEKYFSDCKIKIGNMESKWVRFIDNNILILHQQNIFEYEPQLLIYEVTDQFFEQQMNFNNSREQIQIGNNNNINQNHFNNNNIGFYNNIGNNTGINMNNNTTMMNNINNMNNNTNIMNNNMNK